MCEQVEKSYDAVEHGLDRESEERGLVRRYEVAGYGRVLRLLEKKRKVCLFPLHFKCN